MSELAPSPEENKEIEEQGIALANEIVSLKGSAKSDEDYKQILAKTAELKKLFGISAPESKLEGEIAKQVEKAKEILASDCLGPQEVEKAFGVKLESSEVPNIPFSELELKRAKELNQMLVLRINKGADGKALTMQEINDSIKAVDSGKILYEVSWYKDEEFYTKETPNIEWALVSKKQIPDSTSKDYWQQSKALVSYIKDDVCKDIAKIPEKFQEAIDELYDYQNKKFKDLSDDAINERLRSDEDWQKYAREISELKINQLFRQTPIEAIYDWVLKLQNSKDRLMTGMYAWTKRRDSDGSLVSVGSFDTGGADVAEDRPDDRYGGLGVSFSRSL